MRHIILVGALPPPVHGMAAVNAAIYDQLKDGNIELSVIDISASTLHRSLIVRFGRLPRVIWGLGKFLFHFRHKGDTLYMSISGGLGQLYELAFLSIARLFSMRVYLHYHSFAYLNRYNPVTNALAKVGGPSCVHITLSPGMASRLRSCYPAARKVLSLSNVVFSPETGVSVQGVRPCLITIGFLSNISIDKGIFDFLDLVTACENAGLQLKAKIAGPFQDADTEKKVKQRLAKTSIVKYVGPKYGNDKILFLDSIDALIFPTRYVNEAEPLTLHEAMQNYLPVIAYGRGSIPEIVDSKCGLVIDTEKPFVPEALARLKQWLDRPEDYRAASRAARERFVSTQNDNLSVWKKLIGDIHADHTG